MSDLQRIRSALEITARRRRLDRGLRAGWAGVLTGAALWLILTAAFKIWPLSEGLVAWSPMAILAGAAIGFVWGWSRPLTMGETARWVDGRKQFQERLSTALEVGEKAPDEDWGRLIVADAAKRLPEIEPRQLLPFHLPKASRWALLLLAVGFGLGFVPEYRTKTFVQQQTDEKAIKEAGRELAQLTKRTLQTRPAATEQVRKAIEQAGDLGEHLAKAELTRGDALKDLASMTEKLKEQTREMAKDPAVRNLEKAARASSKGGGSPSADLQQKMESLAKQLGAKAANPDALDKLRNDLDKAKQMAADMPKGATPEAKDAQNKLEASLADLAKQAKDLGLDLPSLTEAIAALQNSLPDQVLQDLQVAEIELEKVQQMAKALEKMQLDAQKLGKDLAEQLKSGQAEAAQATLQKMAQQMESGKMSPQDMEKTMEEVKSALEAAEKYGEVGEELKKAVAQASSGKAGEAGQSLAKAAAALGKMSQELGDAQSLLSTLEALQQAQMVIANGQGWGQGSSPNRRRGAGDGQSTGRGVGTWHDENSWEYPEFQDKWDNSGLTQPEMDARGISERGDGQLADNLLPTKVKGQITPGGPMPSVTLKGVSIKGTSKVDFKEVAAAAQSEAQSALNQDQVPRAYQNAVRNYFDDLKE